MDGVGPSRPRPITVTFFPDFGASSKREQTLTLDELAAIIRTTTKPRKDKLPWLKLARFGDVTTEKRSLRHDANMSVVTGIEGDYDGEVMAVETAMEIAAKADLLCLIYTSPNRTYCADPTRLNGVRYLCRLGADNALITFDGQDVGTPTSFSEQLDRLCSEIKPDLLVLDTIADLFPASENDRAKVRQFVQGSLGGLARRHSCGVLALGHPSVTGLNSGSGQSGSTAWNNTFRSRFYLSREEGEDADATIRVLTRKKANYAARDAELKLRWTDGAFALASAAAPPGKGGDVAWEQIQQIFDEIDRAWHAGRPWSHRPEVRKDGRMIQVWAHEHLRVSEKRLTKLLSSWLMNGFLDYPLFDKAARLKGLHVVRRLNPV